MQIELEEMTKEYSPACAKAVRDAIHELAEKRGQDAINGLNEQDYTDEPLYWRIY